MGAEMSLPEEGREGPLEALSLLADGQASSDQAREAVALWARDASAQERWQTWHLVGDVLRSADLAPAHAQGDMFLSQLQARLRQEPVPLTPPRWSAAWAVQVGKAMKVVLGQWPPARGPLVASGSVAVLALALVLGAGEAWQGLRSSPAASVSGSTAVELAAAPSARPVTVVAAPPAASRAPGPEAREASAAAAAAPVWQPADGRLIRDARLDEYLRAHRAGGPALPGGATGRFETVVLER